MDNMKKDEKVVMMVDGLINHSNPSTTLKLILSNYRIILEYSNGDKQYIDYSSLLTSKANEPLIQIIDNNSKHSIKINHYNGIENIEFKDSKRCLDVYNTIIQYARDKYYCSKCGSIIEKDSTTCIHCGNVIDKSCYKHDLSNKIYKSRGKHQGGLNYSKFLKYIIPVVILIAGIMLYRHNKIEFPVDSQECTSYYYKDLESLLEKSGFKNVELVKLNDLTVEQDKLEGMVGKVVVENRTAVSKGEKIDKQSTITIKYHSIKEYDVNIEIKCTKNYIFNKYDIDFYLDDTYVNTIKQGKNKEIKLSLPAGKHTFMFESSKDNLTRGGKVVRIKGDTNIGYNIICYNDTVKVTEVYVENLSDLKENDIMMKKTADDYLDENYKEVVSELQAMGFKYIDTQVDYDIYLGITKEGSVEDVSIDGNSSFRRGDIFHRESKVIVRYHMNQKDNPSKKNTQ